MTERKGDIKMTKYELFKKLLAMVEDGFGEVVDADLNFYNGGLKIDGVDAESGTQVTIEASIKRMGEAE